MIRDLSKIQHNLQYQFSDISLLELALTHRSKRKTHNERLEFLGDAILSAVIAEDLYFKFPLAKEGKLSQMRTALVRGGTLTELAKTFELNEYIEFGESELKSGGYKRDRVLEDAFEALIGAVYLDRGFEATKLCILSWYKNKLDNLSLSSNVKDAKTKLQEILQKNNLTLPVYSVVKEEGKAHEKIFHIQCEILELNEQVTVVARKRKIGENQAAQILCDKILTQHTGLLGE